MNILFPIETINRELDYRLLLAASLAGQGHVIYMGQHDYLEKIMPHIKGGGLYLGKNIFHKSADQEDFKHYKILKANGFDVLYMHEEGAVFEGDETDWKNRLTKSYDTSVFDDQDLVMDWGDFQQQFDQARTPRAKVVATGHPRFELYKPNWRFYYEEKASTYQKKYGRYIMVMGNYIIGNHGLGYEHIFSKKGGYQVENEQQRLYRVGHYTYHAQQMHAMVELTHNLAVEFKDITFIYRPHPSENQVYYETVFKEIANIIVNHQDEVGPWISGAIGLIHDGCTTAIEATLAEIPVINYKPLNNNHYQYWLPNQLGGKTTTIEEAKEMIRQIAMGLYQKEVVPALVLPYFANFKQDALAEFLKALQEKIQTKKTSSSAIPITRIKKEFVKKELIELIQKNILRWVAPDKYKEYKYHTRKFYGFEEQKVESKLNLFRTHYDKRVNFNYINSKLIIFKD